MNFDEIEFYKHEPIQRSKTDLTENDESLMID